ncbi:hypothetical protein [Actinospongicola halichondriae]|uniref:hypothetical protein n=1 Tax=Actinospongicola halichondriae TaxID=3236844 RepID=UPI003D4E9078
MSPTTSLQRARQICAGLTLALVFLLAILAGRFLFLGNLIIETHGYIGNGVFILALVNLGLALADKADGGELAVAGMIALLTFTQIGLGYVGRDTADAAAIHIPNGVLLMGLAGYQFATTRTAKALPVG